MNEIYNDKKFVEDYIKMVEEIDNVEIIEKLNFFIKEGDTILEMGSGSGKDWETLNKKYSVIGSDNSIEFLNHLRRKYSKGEFLELNASTININKKFDCVYSNKVLYHLNNENLEKSIKRQGDILNTEGIICHTFCRGEREESFKGMYVNNHTNDEVKEFFEKYFKILILENYKEFEDNDSILIIAKKLNNG